MMRTFLWTVAVVVLAVKSMVRAEAGDTNDMDHLDDKFKQMMWKRCALQLTPTCLKLTLARLMDRLSQDTHFQALPGVVVSSNRSRALQYLPAATSRSDLPLPDRIDSYLLAKTTGYLRSLTLSVNLLDLPSLPHNTTGILDNVVARVTGRKDKGNNGLLGLGLMFGGALMTMMMSALAAMAGKALMTSMMALMLAAMGAMKGGGGGGKSTTYEIIAQPEVSHAHSHSSEVHHAHGW